MTIDEYYKAHSGTIYRYLLSLCHDHHTAEEILQETFYRAYLFIEKLDGDSIRPWLFKVAYCAFIDNHRKHSRSSTVPASEFEKLMGEDSPENLYLHKEQQRQLTQAMNALPVIQKQAVLLCDFNGFSYQEAADIMDISLSSFKITLYRARQALRSKKEEILS